MLAVDTNIVVRFLVADDLDQYAKAKAVFAGGAWISSTVILETEWVLRRVLRMTPIQVVEAFASLAGSSTIEFEHPDRLAIALEDVRQGMDFANAMHRASASNCEAFLTFDLDMIRVAGRTAGPYVRQP